MAQTVGTTDYGLKHRCAARGCETRIPVHRLMCYVHWFKVPAPIRTAIWNTYRPGQERDRRPSPEYLVAARDAVDAVAEKESADA